MGVSAAGTQGRALPLLLCSSFPSLLAQKDCATCTLPAGGLGGARPQQRPLALPPQLMLWP